MTNRPPDGARTLAGLAHTWNVPLMDAGLVAIASGWRPTEFRDGNGDVLYAPPQKKEAKREKQTEP